jgi:hypothetical protein
MLLRRCGVIAAWKEFAGLLGRNIGDFILYVLVVLAAGIVLGMIASVVVVMGCCCFFCIAWVFLIPVVGGYLATVLLLPLRVWRRSYAALVLAQFGAAYDVFALAQLPAAPSEDIPSEPAE